MTFLFVTSISIILDFFFGLSQESQMLLSQATFTIHSGRMSRLSEAISPACPQSALGFPPRWAYPNYLPKEESGKHPDQMPSVEDHWLYFRPFSSLWLVHDCLLSVMTHSWLVQLMYSRSSLQSTAVLVYFGQYILIYGDRWIRWNNQTP